MQVRSYPLPMSALTQGLRPAAKQADGGGGWGPWGIRSLVPAVRPGRLGGEGQLIGGCGKGV